MHSLASATGQHLSGQHQQLASASSIISHGTPEHLNILGELQSSNLQRRSNYLYMMGWSIVVVMLALLLMYTLTDPGGSEIGLIILIFGLIVAYYVFSWLWSFVFVPNSKKSR